MKHTPAAFLLALCLLGLQACEERQAPPPVQPAAQQPAAPAEPQAEYRLGWGELPSEPRFGDEPLTDHEAIGKVLNRLEQEGEGFVLVMHSSGRFIQTTPQDGGLILEFHDTNRNIHINLMRPATLEEVRAAFIRFAQGENEQPTGEDWGPVPGAPSGGNPR